MSYQLAALKQQTCQDYRLVTYFGIKGEDEEPGRQQQFEKLNTKIVTTDFLDIIPVGP